jgi:magnesium transporter
MLENYKEVVEALESTNEAVLSHRLNDTFRVLTAISVIVLPLTLIASIWGMNTNVPGEGSHAGFFAVVGVMVIVLAATIALFKRRGWL